jgi:hypothetical protein
MTLLRDKKTRPGTHAIVIGVGRYPWLKGGKKRPTFPENDGMEQLTSPPASARAFAEWLLGTYDNPKRKLATLELLLSDSGSQDFKTGGRTVAIEPATFGSVEAAIKRWAERSKKPDDLLLFFFSGHGICAGMQTTLLLEDFGSDGLAPLSDAIDFNKLFLGLDRIPARQQCFFVDACRVATTTVLETFNQYGQAVIDPKAALSAVPRQAPVFQSTLPGQLAYGRAGKPSYFTEALLRSFEGAATDDDDDGMTWWVQTDALQKALPPLLRRLAARGEQPPSQPPVSNLSRFPLHRLKGKPARIPVDLSCADAARMAEAILSWTDGKKGEKRSAPQPEPWALELSQGQYTFSALLRSPSRRKKELAQDIRPHYRNVRIPV